MIDLGTILFLAAPFLLWGVLRWRFPQRRPVARWKLPAYLVFITALIWGALAFVGHVASAQVPLKEVALVVWFTMTWRLAWSVWSRSVGRLGQRWVRWARFRRSRRQRAPWSCRLIPVGRAMLTVFVFVPLFLSCVTTHRCKLHDGQDPDSVYGMRFERVRIATADGLTLDGWFVPAVNGDRTIIVCHGAGANKGNFIHYLGPLSHHGYNVVFFDFRAHGRSAGRVTTYGIRERRDVRAVVDWLKRERPAQARRIVGLGSSLGAMALASAAAEDPRIEALVLDSPFTSPRELAHHHARRVPVVGPVFVDLVLAGMSAQTGVNFFDASAIGAVSSLGDRPVMVIHGEDDFLMPVEHARRLHDAATGPRELWLGPGMHSNIITTAPHEYEKRLFRFLDKHLGPNSHSDRRAPRSRPADG